jgi:alkylation response protein AidB-like acyl-CoA dehydrogenase
MNDEVGFALPDEIEELRRAAVRFAENELAPAVRDAETAGTWSPNVLAVLKGFSLRELDLPVELGGVGAGSFAKVVLLETLAVGDAAGLPAADQPGISMGALVACPDTALAQEVASGCITGEAQAALVMADAELTESIRIEWAPSWLPLRWAWISRGDSLRLVKVTAPIETTRALAFQASGGATVEVAGGETLGEWTLAPRDGIAVRGRARLWAAAVAIGVAQSSFDATIAYTTQRIVFGKPVAYHQGNAFDLASAATNLHGARLLVQDAAAAYDRGDAYAGFWATQAWLSAIDAGVTITDLGIQLLGGHGFLVDHLAEKRFREARMLGLMAGGRDAAVADVAAVALDVPDPLFAG